MGESEAIEGMPLWLAAASKTLESVEPEYEVNHRQLTWDMSSRNRAP